MIKSMKIKQRTHERLNHFRISENCKTFDDTINILLDKRGQNDN